MSYSFPAARPTILALEALPDNGIDLVAPAGTSLYSTLISLILPGHERTGNVQEISMDSGVALTSLTSVTAPGWAAKW